MARKTKLSKELIRMAYDLTKEGHYVEDVAEYLDINPQSYYNWMNQGEELSEMDDEELTAHLYAMKTETERKNARLFLEFFETVKRAQTEAKMTALRNIRKAGKKSWQAEAWYLERKFRHQFGRVQIVEDGSSGNNDSKQGLLSKLIAGVDAIASDEGEANE